MSLLVHRELRRRLIRRSLQNSAIVATLILAALAVGMIGYHLLDGLSWLDAALNASMILTGMGPVSPVSSAPAKVFAIVYALFSGVFFLTMVAILLAPALHHIMHRVHLELKQSERPSDDTPKGAGVPVQRRNRSDDTGGRSGTRSR